MVLSSISISIYTEHVICIIYQDEGKTVKRFKYAFSCYISGHL